MKPNSAAKPSSATVGPTAPLSPTPRHVIASRPSTAQRAGTTTVICWSQAGKTNVGTQAPPSITISSTASVLTPRAACGVWPNAAMSKPNVAAISEHARATLKNPMTLPSMRTRNTTMAKPNDTSSVISDTMVMLSVFPASSVTFETGALRSRRHSPRWRSSSTSIPRLAVANSRN